MPQQTYRRRVWRCTLAAAGMLALAVLWLSVLTFDPADPPAANVWPPNQPLHNACGSVGATLAYYALYYLGWGLYPLLVLLTAGFVAWLRERRPADLWLRAIGTALLCTSVSALAAMFGPASPSQPISGPGGVLGAATAAYLLAHLQTAGSVIMLVCTLFVGLIVAADEPVIRVASWLLGLGRRSGDAIVRTGGAALASAGAAVANGAANMTTRVAEAHRSWRSVSSPADRRSSGRALEDEDEDETRGPQSRGAGAARGAASREATVAVDDEAEQLDLPLEGDDAPQVDAPDAPPPPPPRPSPRVTRTGGSGPAPPPEPRPRAGDYVLPPVSLLEDPEPIDREAIEELCREKAYTLEKTLQDFRIDVQVVAIETGPVITVFELKLAPGVKVSQIASLANDMARALRAPSVRVVAPLPGKNTIGIEVPNLDKEKVRIKELVGAMGRRLATYQIPLFLGKDASGQPLVSDLTRMPHLLIAGTTGSGKSVCVSSLIASMLLTRSPDEVQMILIDPKVVELAMFKDIPHLMCPIVTEVSRAEGILDWAANKMDERYALLAEAGVKDIRAYNRLGEQELRERMGIESDEEMARIPVHLPYIVIVVDELADLMMTSAKEVEFYLCRLAQKSRAVGIHLIVSTQRPQATVVTGLIKSNLPCRICFRVSSRLDSRIVLDQNGGEVLMGQGDMLFLPPGSAKLIRAQGTYVSEGELRALVRHCRQQAEPQYHPELTRAPKVNSGETERDELFDQAVEVIVEAGRGSVSLLQRKLGIGYGRASRLIDQMYDAGIVGDYKGSQAREVLVSLEEWQQMRAMRDREETLEAGAARDADG